MIDPNQERETLRGRPAPGTGSPAPTFVRSTGCRTDGAAGILRGSTPLVCTSLVALTRSRSRPPA
jgi:hypothetical protein